MTLRKELKDRNLRRCLGWWAVVLLAALIYCCYGCAPEYHVGMCRQRAVECALIYGEIYHPLEVGIASGAVNADKRFWHSQAYLDRPDRRLWLRNTGFGCEIGNREPFTPSKFESVGEYLNTVFGSFGYFSGPRVPKE